MWYTILLSLVVDVGGLVLVYLVLRDRLRRALAAETRVGEIRDEVSRLLVELNQATDRNIAVMEDRITVLNDAIATADKKLGLLRRETEKHDVGSQIYSRLAEGRATRGPSVSERVMGSATEAPVAGMPPAVAAVGPHAPAGRAGGAPDTGLAVVTAAAEALGMSPAAAAGMPPAVAAAAEPSGPSTQPDVRQRVMMLFRSGFSPSLIASRVGAPLGEVELIISLEQRKGQA